MDFKDYFRWRSNVMFTLVHPKKSSRAVSNLFSYNSKQWHVQSKECEFNKKNKNADKKKHEL